MLRRTGRVVGLAALGAGLTIMAAACSSSDAGETAPTITIQPQSYQNKPPATLAPETTTEATAGADGTTDQVQHYTVQEDEYPAQIASRFEITLDELLNFNNWELNDQGWVPDFPPPGSVIDIPPGAKFIDPNEVTETTEPEQDEEEATVGTTADGSEIGTVPGTGDPAADRCSTGTYTVEAGDYPIGVAQKFDVTIEALNAANASTPGYSTFYPSLEIVIPAATDC
jgi:LysM repeat protein